MLRLARCSLALCLFAACADDSVTGSNDVAVPDADTITPDGADVPPDVDDADPADATTTPDSAAPDTAADGDASDATTPGDLGARGPFAVGYRTDEVTYAANDGSGDRTLRVVSWYPTRATEGDAVLYFGLLPAEGVLGFAPPADDLGPRPLVVFSHGNGAFAEQSVFLTEHLASHGYLVVAPDHTGNTFGASGLDPAVFNWRPADISAVLDHLENLPEGHPLRGLVSDRVAIAGHSFGGYTTLAVGGATWDVDALLALCEADVIPLGGCAALLAHEALYRAGFADARADALVPMSPGATFVFGAGASAVTAPTLLFTGAMDRTTTNADDGDPTWAALASRPDNRRVDFATGGHFTFSDACSLPVDIGEGDGCGDGFLDPAAAHHAINAYTLAFLRLHLEGDDAGQALLDGDVSIEPDATLSVGQRP